jgi:hypothetical protein
MDDERVKEIVERSNRIVEEGERTSTPEELEEDV